MDTGVTEWRLMRHANGGLCAALLVGGRNGSGDPRRVTKVHKASGTMLTDVARIWLGANRLTVPESKHSQMEGLAAQDDACCHRLSR